MSNEPYDQGNDEWLLRQIKERGIMGAKADFTANECRRILWLCCSGEISALGFECEALEKRIIHIERKERENRALMRKTKNL